jgi:hypothetical protein
MVLIKYLLKDQVVTIFYGSYNVQNTSKIP